MSVPSSTFGDYSDTITNDEATAVTSNYEVSQRSGQRAKIGSRELGLVRQWDGLYVLPWELDHRHPQELRQGSRGDSRYLPSRSGSGPEDEFLTTNQVSTEDL